MLGIEDIMKVLPHRYPFLLVDRILEIEAGKRVVGIKNVTINEPFFAGSLSRDIRSCRACSSSKRWRRWAACS